MKTWPLAALLALAACSSPAPPPNVAPPPPASSPAPSWRAAPAGPASPANAAPPPAPTPTDTLVPDTSNDDGDPDEGAVTPGAYCSTSGDIGHHGGHVYTCQGPGRLRWRR